MKIIESGNGTKIIYGLDPSLRHGQLVFAAWDFTASPVIGYWEPLYQWTKKSPESIGVDATPTEIYTLSKRISNHVQNPTGLVAIDWDPHTISWKSRRDQNIRLAFFMGYLARAIQERGNIPVFITPAEVRRTFQLHPRIPKEEVWAAASASFVLAGQPSVHGPVTDSDTQDAIILTYVLARRLEDGRPPQNNLPSG